ncbi:MAG: OB-fold nucleic acid binding domain-containing protein [Nanoarchaeota archaeon]
MAEQFQKRQTAFKLRIGDVLRANQIFDETPPPEKQQENLNQRINPRLLHVDLGDKQIQRVNIISNVIDKYESDGETRFATITLDDGSGQIRARLFGEDIKKFQDIVQGDTLLIIGVLRSYNQELYIMPEIIKKQDPKYLLVRKLEIEKSTPKPLTSEQKQEIKAYRDEIIDMIKEAEPNEGIDKDEIINKLKNTNPKLISQEIQKLLEEGIIYEPKPGRVRYLG